MRIIHFKDNRTSAKPLYIQSRILPICEELKLKNCMLAFEILRADSLVRLFFNFCTPIGDNHQYQTKSSKNKIIIDRTRTVRYGTYNIKAQIATHWNKLVPRINVCYRNISKNVFKKHTKALLYSDLAS